MPLALLVVLSYFLDSSVQGAVSTGVLAMILVMVIEGVFLARLVTRRVHERYPDEPAGTLKLGLYAFVRASQLRRAAGRRAPGCAPATPCESDAV